MILHVVKTVLQGCSNINQPIQKAVIRCMRTQRSKSIVVTSRSKWHRHTESFIRKADKVCKAEHIIYRTGMDFLFYLKWPMILINPVVLYQVYKEVTTYMAINDDLIHPSQIDIKTAPPIVAIGAMVIYAAFTVAVLVITRTMVKRIYFNEENSTYRLIVGNYLGNRQFSVGPGQVRTYKSGLFNHTVTGKSIYLQYAGFSKVFYYKHLLGDVDSSGNSSDGN